jgi:hypothetical protein
MLHLREKCTFSSIKMLLYVSNNLVFISPTFSPFLSLSPDRLPPFLSSPSWLQGSFLFILPSSPLSPFSLSRYLPIISAVPYPFTLSAFSSSPFPTPCPSYFPFSLYTFSWLGVPLPSLPFSTLPPPSLLAALTALSGSPVKLSHFQADHSVKLPDKQKMCPARDRCLEFIASCLLPTN